VKVSIVKCQSKFKNSDFQIRFEKKQLCENRNKFYYGIFLKNQKCQSKVIKVNV